MRIVTAREQYEMLEPFRCEAGRRGELPEGLRYENRGDGGSTFGYLGDQEVGYLRPSRDQNPTIDMIQVHPDYRRRGVGTDMLQWHRENVGPLDHSTNLTPNGRAWSKAQGHNPKKWTRQPPDDGVWS